MTFALILKKIESMYSHIRFWVNVIFLKICIEISCNLLAFERVDL